MIGDNSLGSKAFDYFLIVLLVCIALLCVLPIWYTLAVSFSEKSAAASGIVRLWPIGFNINSYKQIVNDHKFFNSFGISLERVLIGGCLNFILTILTAYPLSKSAKSFRPRNIFMWILVFTMLFNGGMIPWFMTIKALGLVDTIWALVLPGAVPVFNVILLVNFFRNLPKELEEAAVVDGAGPWYIMVRIFVPLSLSALATVTLFSIVTHWNSFFDGLVLMTRAEHYPLQTYIQQMVVQINTQNLTEDQYAKLNELSNQTLNAAKIFIAMIPILLVYPFLQRFFIHGITLGSVKE